MKFIPDIIVQLSNSEGNDLSMHSISLYLEREGSSVAITEVAAQLSGYKRTV